MKQVTMLIRNVILRAEKNTFMVRIILTVIGYVGITFWLNIIRQTAPIWVVWILVGVQLFLFLTFFVVCLLRLRQCRKQSWWLHIATILSLIENWKFMTIPIAIIITLFFSQLNQNVSKEREHLLPPEEDSTCI